MKIDKSKLVKSQGATAGLTGEQWRELMKLLDEGYTHASVSQAYGVSQTAVSYVRQGWLLARNAKK